jgi:hypothetical protein
MDSKATGKDIILAILDNMRESQEPLLFSTLVASHYDIYLHRQDFDRLEPILPRIREEAGRALKEELERIQAPRRSILPGFKRGAGKTEAAQSEWQIKFHVDEDEELVPGDILIDSRLTMPQQKEFGTGAKTQRMVTIRSGGETRKLSGRSDAAEDSGTPVARLTYTDKDGQRQEYLMTTPEIAIGRGGRAEYCDLQLDGPADISRQHVYLRRDESGSDFFIQDVSRFGTTVDGAKVAHKEWVKLPAKARLKLAGKVVIDFERL